jgi:Cys-tRNA(Pro)/Cys-tRNA(Cys) deacylase
MAKGTWATVALEKAGIPFTLHQYVYDPGEAGVGAQAARALGIAPARSADLVRLLDAEVMEVT